MVKKCGSREDRKQPLFLWTEDGKRKTENSRPADGILANDILADDIFANGILTDDIFADGKLCETATVIPAQAGISISSSSLLSRISRHPRAGGDLLLLSSY